MLCAAGSIDVFLTLAEQLERLACPVAGVQCMAGRLHSFMLRTIL
ncbi:hypothetical protein [Sporolactobacillus sp. THM19-2]|nr:hypothetical protein [Sporolactobacillus sp. THM19-2]